jgi:2-polyprenyl-3-methyl-5-hydroxy-6-metoxy-1,4-benzoquinol methylase
MHTYTETIRCPVCDSKKRRVKYIIEYLNILELKIVACLLCGIYYVANPLRNQYLAKYYDIYYGITGPATMDPLTIAQYTISAEKRRKTFLTNLPSGFNLGGAWLDVGCGCGFILKSLGDFFSQSQGVECSESSVKFARSTLGVTVNHGQFNEDSFSMNSLDLITFFDVLEHVISPRQFLRLASRFLKPNGWVLITTVNLRSLSRVLLGKQWQFFTPIQHLTYFHAEALKTLLKDYDFNNFTVYSSTREDLFPVTPLLNILKAKSISKRIQALEEVRLAYALGLSSADQPLQKTDESALNTGSRFRSFLKLPYNMLAVPLEQLIALVSNILGRTDNLWIWAQKKSNSE